VKAVTKEVTRMRNFKDGTYADMSWQKTKVGVEIISVNRLLDGSLLAFNFYTGHLFCNYHFYHHMCISIMKVCGMGGIR
jgi:hypothetical protein